MTETDPEQGQFRGQVGEGQVRDVDTEKTERRHVFAFASDAEVPVAEIEVWADPNRQPTGDSLEGWTDVSASIEDRTAVVEGTTDTADAFEWGDTLDSQSTSLRPRDGTVQMSV